MNYKNIKVFSENRKNNLAGRIVLCNMCCIFVCYGMYYEAVYKCQT